MTTDRPLDVDHRREGNLIMKTIAMACDRSVAPGWHVVPAGTDLDAAVEHALHACFDCTAALDVPTERILVHPDVHDAFVARLKARAAERHAGSPADGRSGALDDHDDTLAHLAERVDDAWTRGAVITQYGSPSGRRYPPTIVTGVTPDMKIFTTDTYGPVAPVIKAVGPGRRASRVRQARRR
jgi:succinate-semialdehyde dehydrogenase/glutarate-semialdehyde dehydrogenase